MAHMLSAGAIQVCNLFMSLVGTKSNSVWSQAVVQGQQPANPVLQILVELILLTLGNQNV